LHAANGVVADRLQKNDVTAARTHLKIRNTKLQETQKLALLAFLYQNARPRLLNNESSDENFVLLENWRRVKTELGLATGMNKVWRKLL
jgi:hypothetical protein